MGKCKFHSEWIKEFSWLKAVDKDPHKAYCKLCNSEFGVGVHGYTDVTRHENGRDHQKAVKAATGASLQQFFKCNLENLMESFV